MNTLEFIKDISWQAVALVALLVLLAYRQPLGNLISNLRSGSVSYKRGEGVTGNLEVNNPAIGSRYPELLNQELIESRTIEYIESNQELTENNVTEKVEIIKASVEENTAVDDWLSLYALLDGSNSLQTEQDQTSLKTGKTKA